MEAPPASLPTPSSPTQNQVHDLIMPHMDATPTPLIHILHSIRNNEDPQLKSIVDVDKLRKVLDEIVGVEVYFDNNAYSVQNLTVTIFYVNDFF